MQGQSITTASSVNAINTGMTGVDSKNSVASGAASDTSCHSRMILFVFICFDVDLSCDKNLGSWLEVGRLKLLLLELKLCT